jgi:hypothetical protein
MYAEQDRHSRTLGLYGPAAQVWIAYEPRRAAGFPLALGGQQRVLGFPPGPPSRIRIRLRRRRPRLRD